ncbi:MAG TPA: stage II sporulation protein M [Vicinamibacterales bacterium]|nr:stage II sporulation protein M [Vicinamibacterales bacterium]
MISNRWLRDREPYWQRLEELLDRIARQGMRALARAELQELGLLYRQIASDLAILKEDPASARYAENLNRLLARAHHSIYAVDRPPASTTLAFFLDTFPRVFRRNLAPCAASLAIFLAAAVVGATLAYRHADFKALVLGPDLIDTIERHEMWTHAIVGIKPVASSTIMTNNMTVALMTFATGIAAGLGTVYMLAFNGLLLGVIGMACAMAGMNQALWSFVAPHGVLELPAIIIAGGAGLRLAEGVLFPGLLPRREAVVSSGSDAIQIVLGCIPLLVVAGIIEAFVSPTNLPVTLKFGLAGGLATLLIVYLFRPMSQVRQRSVKAYSSV